MKRVFTTETASEAHVVAGLLEDAGIRAVVEGEMLTGARYALGVDRSTQSSVSVPDEDAERAAELIRERPPADGEDEPEPVGRGLVWFKRFLLVWVALTLVGVVWSFVEMPIALAILCVFAIVGLLLSLLRRRS